MTWISKSEQWPPVGDRGISLKFNRGGVEWVKTGCVIEGGRPVEYDYSIGWDDDLFGCVDEVTHWDNAYALGAEWFDASEKPRNGSMVDIMFDVHGANDHVHCRRVMYNAVYAFGKFIPTPGDDGYTTDPDSCEGATLTHWRYTIKK